MLPATLMFSKFLFGVPLSPPSEALTAGCFGGRPHHGHGR